MRDVLAIATDIVEHQSFTQREVAQRDVFGPETAQDRVEQDAAGDDEIRAARVEARNCQALCERESHDLLAQTPNLFRADAQVTQLARDRAIGHCRGDGTQAQNRSRRPNHTVETGAGDLLAVAIDLAEDVLRELLFVTTRQRIAFDESLRQANHADLEAPGRLNRGGRAKRDLRASAADVDDDSSCAADIHPVDGRQVDQSRLLGTGDHPRTNAGFRVDAREKLSAVARFARGARRGSENLVHRVRFGKPFEFGERLQRGAHRLGGEFLAVESTGAEAHHRLFAIDDFE